MNKGRVKKKVEFPMRGGASARPDFPLKEIKIKTNMGLKHWILPKDHFKTHLFFFNFWVGGPFSAWIR